MRKWLMENLLPFRYNHSLGTEKIAERLAQKHGLDSQKAAIAGLCHDCAKQLPDDELISIAKANNIEIDSITRITPHLLHAPVGAIIAGKEFDIKDKEILSAIASHAVPSKNMSQLDMLINMCDLIEESRDFNDITKAREDAEISIEKGFLTTLKALIIYLIKNDVAIHPNSIHIYNKLIKK